MGKKTKKRRHSHGSAWLWKQTDCWYYTRDNSTAWLNDLCGYCGALPPALVFMNSFHSAASVRHRRCGGFQRGQELFGQQSSRLREPG